ncbi:ABC transporter substrate-binding protein [Alicycliphilus denitrificans]|uniref:Extracellular ligand-binding receptor n=1 Tax=Alicycliphilus denitrificans (strain DSM 14773 / CIP 107495 / K601) TaxID=596154 RepID=F4GFD9_ALIDK|nr:ABC transporter substrate-binding protein [Alicycliphilus denitrificans]AEB83871.1 Extracellular ligand-binding receptor [Alicycliphilus denitrificans K601]
MRNTFRLPATLIQAAGAAALLAMAPLCAAETIKLGLSIPLSGSGANWGKGSEWMCAKAAQEVNAQGGVKVKGQAHQFECVGYDNKYNAAEGAKVAQALVARDEVKFVAGSIGVAPARALQSLTERRNVLLFTAAWGNSMKGPKFPLTFSQMNSPNEISEPLITHVKKLHPGVKTVVLLNPNDATGQETEKVAKAAWEKNGVKVLVSDWYERGTSEFQPIAAKLHAAKPDVVDLASTPPADAGLIFKELKALGWNGVKVVEVGTGADGLLATGKDAVEGAYLGAAVSVDSMTPQQKALDEGVRKATGESVNAIQIGFYDAVWAIKAAMEKAQSIDPAEVAKAMPTVRFKSFYGETGFGGKDVYGSDQQMRLPVIITKLVGTSLQEVGRVQK